MVEPTTFLEKISHRFTLWVGSISSVVIHTIFFVGIFALRLFGVSTEEILLVLTTIVSLEAIYLAIFIQMTVNRNTQSLQEVEEDIEELGEEVEDLGEDLTEIGEDITELSEDIDELSEDVDEISEDVDKIQEEDASDEREDVKTRTAIDNIEVSLQKLVAEIEDLKKSIRK